MRAVVEVEEIQNRTCLVVTELPYQVNPDNLALKIAELVKDGKVAGIADVRDESSGRTGQRLVIVLKRDAVAKVVLNNLYKHTQLQDNFSANMLALVDGVPRTLPLDGFVRHWVDHQLEVIQRRTRYRLRKAEEEAHILRGYLKALDALDEVIALIRASATVEVARDGLIELLDIDEIQATAILNMQLRRLAALERQKIIDRFEELQALIEDYNAILASPERQRTIVSEELGAIVEKYGDERRTRIDPVLRRHVDGGPDPAGGGRRHDHPRRLRQADPGRPVPLAAARRQGRARRAAARRGRRRPLLHDHDPRLVAVLHQPRAGSTAPRPTSCPRPAATPRVSTSRISLPSNRTSRSPRSWTSRTTSSRRTWCWRPGAVWSRRPGSTEYDSPRTGGLIAINLREDDERRRRRAGLGAARLGRGRPAAGLAQGSVGAVHRDRRGAAADGPGHLRRHRA